ncbi:ABC-three component system protein [Ramlibacter cellulosilyticus]|uniref:ABC-three component system protein n=1 Tax=Ramlibacter cellulosilyticus TaxID=2764187 RepID=UPI003390399D
MVKRGTVPPSVFLHTISDKEWEEFIAAACRQRTIHTAKYVSVKVLGNAGDKGRDVEARLQAALVADGWDLYQAKHYEQRLTPGNAYPELVKFFGHLLAKSFPVPRKYYFCAPKNVGPELHDLLASPDNLRTSLLTAWKAGTHGLNAAKLTSEMEAFINAFDFKRFEECQVVDLLAWYAEDANAYCKLFGIEPERGDDPSVPAQAEAHEMTYISELIRAYAEAEGVPMTLPQVLADEEYREHLAAAREAFYAAEGLKRFSRDIYVEDEFKKLLDMVLTGVRLKVKSPLLKSGLQRHDAAVDAAQALTLTDSVLHTRLRGGDLPGTCHHLVNEKQLTWVR